jgi:hypothetical protein
MSTFRCSSTMSYVLVDNRVSPNHDFQTEAATSAYHRLSSELIGKFILATSSHPLLKTPAGIVIASSTSTVQIVNTADVGALTTLMNPQFSLIGGGSSASHTWSNFLCDALKKIMQQELANNPTTVSTTERRQNTDQLVVTVYSTDTNLLGGDGCGSIQEGITMFRKVSEDFKYHIPQLHIRVVCVRVCNTSFSFSNRQLDHDNAYLLQTELNSKYEWIHIQHIQPSVMIFEEEMKCLLGIIIPKVYTTLEIPSLGGLQCELKIQLEAHTTRCLECISYMKSLETCSVAPRGGIDPLFIAGFGFEVLVPEKLFSWQGFEDPKR